jgi:hypothetical protein
MVQTFVRPSFIGFIFQGIMFLIFIILFLKNYDILDKKDLVYISLITTIAIGVHSMIHYTEEKDNNFNPFVLLGFK